MIQSFLLKLLRRFEVLQDVLESVMSSMDHSTVLNRKVYRNVCHYKDKDNQFSRWVSSKSGISFSYYELQSNLRFGLRAAPRISIHSLSAKFIFCKREINLQFDLFRCFFLLSTLCRMAVKKSFLSFDQQQKGRVREVMRWQAPAWSPAARPAPGSGRSAGRGRWRPTSRIIPVVFRTCPAVSSPAPNTAAPGLGTS